MDDIEKQARQYLKALYGLGEPSADVLPAQNLPAILAFARREGWIVESPEGGHGLTPLGVTEISK
jgi:hypothetical protein